MMSADGSIPVPDDHAAAAGASTPEPTTPPVPLFGASGAKAQLPNILTGARIGAAVAFTVALTVTPDASDPAYRTLIGVALGLFVGAALTDAADGYLARRWNAISVFGRVMDPFADKILILAAFIVLPSVGGSGVAAWMAVVIVARELLITSIRGVCESRGIDFSASGAGKLKMIAQSVAVPLILLALLIDPGASKPTTEVANAALAWTTTIITAGSAIPYITRAVSELRAREA